MFHEDEDYLIRGIESCQLSYEVHDDASRVSGKPWIYLDAITAFNFEAPIKNLQRWHYDQNEQIKPNEKITLIES